MAEEGPSQSFVARIWLEREPDGEVTWRGHIRHVQSDRERYFGTLREMKAFLEKVTGVRGPASRPVRALRARKGSGSHPGR